MNPDLDHTMALLERTPGALDELLRGLPAEWTERNEGGDTWNAREIVAHLSHCERTDWMPRVKHLLEFGEAQPFPPFDRWASGWPCRASQRRNCWTSLRSSGPLAWKSCARWD